MNDEDIILRLFRQIHSYSFEKNEIPPDFPKKDLEDLKDEDIICEECVPPSQCEECGCHVEYMEKEGKLIIQCDQGHELEEPKSKYIVYRMNLTKALICILKDLVGDFSVISMQTNGDFCKIKLNKEDKSLDTILSLDSEFTEKRLFEILSPHISNKEFIIFIFKDTAKNYEIIDSILQKIPLGNIIFPLPLSAIKNDKIKGELENWLEYTNQIAELENDILNDIGNDELKSLTASVDTNPKYILSALLRLKICKAGKTSAKKKWEEMEHMVTAIFHSLYISDVKYGGAKQRGKSVFDNLFFVKSEDGIKIAGIVDSKCSRDADLSKEKTEKYEHYFELVRDTAWSIPKKALIFVVLDTKSNYTIEEFYDRIKGKLRKGEYMIILPIDSLEILMRAYLGVVLRGKINIKKTDFNDLLQKLFDCDLLDRPETKLQNGLYCVKPEFLLEELKSRAESPSSVETAFEEIFG